jgi:hypothetical protein
MRWRFVLDGPKYSKHKAEFKKMLKDYRLAWRGNMATFLWQGGRERVRAEYERDLKSDVTLAATITWEGRAKTPFLNELKTWVFSLGGTAKEEKATREEADAAKERAERELALWDAVHKPDVQALRAQGRPEEWIERDLRSWKKARDSKRDELRS